MAFVRLALYAGAVAAITAGAGGLFGYPAALMAGGALIWFDLLVGSVQRRRRDVDR